MKKSCFALISFDECKSFLKMVYGKDCEIQITKVMDTSKSGRGFGFVIDNYEGENSLATGYISFKENTCEIALITPSNEVENNEYNNLYMSFIQGLKQQDEKSSAYMTL